MKMKVGSSAVRITPPAGVVLEGYASRKETAVGIHDDLFVSCVVAESKGKILAFLSFDLIGIPNDLVPTLEGIVSKILDIPNENILLSATHTHSGPALLGLQKGNELNELWLEILPNYVETCVKQSTYAVRECYPMVGETQEKFVGRNRRKPNGITDPTLTVLSFVDRRDGKPLALIVNYACHATILDNTNLFITSDYINWLRETVRRYHPDTIVLFFNGAEGDVNIGYSAERSLMGQPVKVERNFKMAERMGRIIGFDTLAALEKSSKMEDDRIVSRMKKVKIHRRKGRKIEELERMMKSTKDDLERFFLDQELNVVKNFPDEFEIQLQVIRFSDLTIFSLPVEPFTKVGLELRSMSRTKRNMVVGLANGWYGYLPTPDEFELGGYETRLGPWSYLDENASDLILEAFTEMLNEIERCDEVIT